MRVATEHRAWALHSDRRRRLAEASLNGDSICLRRLLGASAGSPSCPLRAPPPAAGGRAVYSKGFHKEGTAFATGSPGQPCADSLEHVMVCSRCGTQLAGTEQGLVLLEAVCWEILLLLSKPTPAAMPCCRLTPKRTPKGTCHAPALRAPHCLHRQCLRHVRDFIAEVPISSASLLPGT